MVSMVYMEKQILFYIKLRNILRDINFCLMLKYSKKGEITISNLTYFRYLRM